MTLTLEVLALTWSCKVMLTWRSVTLPVDLDFGSDLARGPVDIDLGARGLGWPWLGRDLCALEQVRIWPWISKVMSPVDMCCWHVPMSNWEAEGGWIFCDSNSSSGTKSDVKRHKVMSQLPAHAQVTRKLWALTSSGPCFSKEYFLVSLREILNCLSSHEGEFLKAKMGGKVRSPLGALLTFSPEVLKYPKIGGKWGDRRKYWRNCSLFFS